MVDVVPKRKIGRSKWDTDRAVRSTYSRLIGRYQLRLFSIICIVFGVTESWVSGVVFFNAIPPNNPLCLNVSNQTKEQIKRMMIMAAATGLEEIPRTNISQKNSQDITINDTLDRPDWSQQGVLTPIQVFSDFNVSTAEPKNIHVQFGLLCGDENKIQYSRIGFIMSKHIGAFLCGYIADQVGRKITLIGSALICYAMLLFQILSEDFVSYCFFMIFIGLAAGGVITISITYTMETCSINSRSVYAVILLTVPFILDLIIPWLAYGLRWWKLLQSVAGLPLILAGLLYWWSEETVYYYTSQKDYCQAIESLTRIAKFNKIAFHSRFKEAQEFLRGKKSKAAQCDFQPLLRVQDIPKLQLKYPAFNFAEVNDKPNEMSVFRKILFYLSGKHFHPNSTARFKITDYIQSAVLMSYILLIAALWFVNGVTFSSLESDELSWRLKKSPYTGYCYSALTAIVAAIVALPTVYKLGRRWPIFCFYLVGEVCLLASIVAKIEREFTPVTLSLIYLFGKAAAYGAYIVLAILTVEIFPTGLRCTSLGIGFLFRGIGIVLADPDLLNFHDWTARLIYGFLSLLIGSLALFLPEMRRYPLSRTFAQVETIPSGISKRVRHVRKSIKDRKRKRQPLPAEISKPGHVRFITPSGLEYDPQSTMHTVYEVPHTAVLRSDVNRSEFETIREEDVNSAAVDDDDSNVHMCDMDYKTQHDDAYFSENL